MARSPNRSPKTAPPAATCVHKTGTLVWENLLNDRMLLTSKALGGYITTKSGRKLAFAVFVNGVHLKDGIDSKRVGSDLGKLCELIYNEL